MSNTIDVKKIKTLIVKIHQDQFDEFGKEGTGYDLVRRFARLINRINESRDGLNSQIKCKLIPTDQNMLKKINEFYSVYLFRWENLSEKYSIKDIWESRKKFVGYTDNMWKMLAVRILSILYEHRYFIPFEDHYSFHTNRIILEKGSYIYKIITIAMKLGYVKHTIRALLNDEKSQ